MSAMSVIETGRLSQRVSSRMRPVVLSNTSPTKSSPNPRSLESPMAAVVVDSHSPGEKFMFSISWALPGNNCFRLRSVSHDAFPMKFPSCQSGWTAHGSHTNASGLMRDTRTSPHRISSASSIVWTISTAPRPPMIESSNILSLGLRKRVKSETALREDVATSERRLSSPPRGRARKSTSIPRCTPDTRSTCGLIRLKVSAGRPLFSTVARSTSDHWLPSTYS